MLFDSVLFIVVLTCLGGYENLNVKIHYFDTAQTSQNDMILVVRFIQASGTFPRNFK